MNIFLTYILHGRRCARLTQHADVDDARGGAHIENLGCSNERGADGEVRLPGSTRVILRMPQRTAIPRDPHGRLRSSHAWFPLHTLILSDSPSPAIRGEENDFSIANEYSDKIKIKSCNCLARCRDSSNEGK